MKLIEETVQEVDRITLPTTKTPTPFSMSGSKATTHLHVASRMVSVLPVNELKTLVSEVTQQRDIKGQKKQ